MGAWLPPNSRIVDWSKGIAFVLLIANGLLSWSLISTMRRKLRSAFSDHVEPAELFGLPPKECATHLDLPTAAPIGN